MTRRGLAIAFGVLGAVVLLLGVLAWTADRSVFSSRGFADATARALEEPAVRAAAGERVADAVIAAEPDLVAARPLLESAATAVVGSRPFRALVRGAAEDLHRSVFERDSGTVSLVLADALVLVADALRVVDPELAARVPDTVRVALVDFSGGLDDGRFADVLQTADHVRFVRLVAFPLAALLLLGAVLLTPDRRRGIVWAAVALGTCGVAVLVLARVGEAVVRGTAPDADPELRDAAGAVWSAFAGDLRVWGLALLAVGVVIAGAAASLVSPRPVAPLLRDLSGRVAAVPSRRRARALRAGAFAVAGVVVVLDPLGAVRLVVVAGGLLLLYAGVAELLRLTLPADVATAPRLRPRGLLRAGAVVAVLVGLVAGGAALAAGGAEEPPGEPVTTCNGHAELCDRPLARVAFAGTHNSMASSREPGWLFAAHALTIPQQLTAGVRALLIDTHYGVRTPRGVFTLLDEGTKSRDKIEEPLGTEFIAAAERLRTRIGFRGDPSGKQVWLCHGYCEVGATLALDALHDIRDFLVRNPGEVVVLSLEDSVTPADMEAVMREAGLLDKAWTGPVTATSPTLGQMIDAGRRLVVMAEEQTGGLPWLHGQFGEVAQETPYAFPTVASLRAPESCARGRGAAGNPMLLLNHWVDTSPAPRPSNARTVNAAAFLRERVRRCAAARGGLRPGIVAVDFVEVGDTIAFVDELNGVGEG